MSSSYTEDHLVEQPAVQFIRNELGWEVVNCYDEWNGGVSNQGRDEKREVVLVSRLRPALQRLNPDLPVEEICRDFFLKALSRAEANREIDKLLRSTGWVLFVSESAERCKRLKMNGFLFELKTSARIRNEKFQAGNPSGYFSQSRRNA